MTNRQGAPSHTRPRIGLIIPRLYDDTIAIMHVKNWNSAATELTLKNEKYFKNSRKKSSDNEKNMPKKSTAFKGTLILIWKSPYMFVFI